MANTGTGTLAALIQYLMHQRHIMDYMFISAASALVYDYFLMLHLEIKYVWLSRWSYTKVLFLGIRYTSFAVTCLALYNQLFPGVSSGTCRISYPAEVWLSLFEMTSAEAILAIRTWAVWNGNKIVGIGLLALILGFSVPQGVLLHKFIQSIEYASPPYTGFKGCFITNADSLLWASYTLAAIIEVFVLALTAVSAFRSYRQGTISKVCHKVHRDGVVSYIYLLCISVANVIVTATLPRDMITILSPWQYSLMSVLATRIVLDIRGVSKQSLYTGFQSYYHSNPRRSSSIPLDLLSDGVPEPSRVELQCVVEIREEVSICSH